MQVYIDMDGVLVDTVGGIARKFDKEQELQCWPPGEYNIRKVFNLPHLWEDLDFYFWANLQKTTFCDELLSLIPDDYIIATYANSSAALSGKISWINEHLHLPDDRVIFIKNKFLLAHDGFLIDDDEKNIDSFTCYGGYGILVPQPWNRNHGLETMSHIKALWSLR